jgi:hypothetical protein
MGSKQMNEYERNFVKCAFCNKKLTTNNAGPWLEDLDRRCCMKCYKTKVNTKSPKQVPMYSVSVKREAAIDWSGKKPKIKEVKVKLGELQRHR